MRFISYTKKIGIIILLFVLCLLLVSCKDKNVNTNNNEPFLNRVIVEKSDYDSWVKNGKNKNDLAKITKKELIKDNTYTFVYIFNLKKEQAYTTKYDDTNIIPSYLTFTLKSWGNIYYNNDAVEYLEYSGESESIHLSLDTSTGDLVVIGNGTREEDNTVYFAVDFKPKYTGLLMVESLVYRDDLYDEYNTNDLVCATVLDKKASKEVTISNVSFGLVSEDVFDNGMLNDTTPLESINMMKVGRNYVVIDYDINTTSEDISNDLIYCGVYLHSGYWNSGVIEETNTSKTATQDVKDGTLFDFAYKVPSSNKKRIRTVLSFVAERECFVDIEISFYSDMMVVSGENYKADFFIEENVSELEFDFEDKNSVCYVKGYKRLTDIVDIPNRYQGKRVLKIGESVFSYTNINRLNLGDFIGEIGENAFSGCNNLNYLDLNNVNYINSGAFSNCSSLYIVSLPDSLRYIGKKAFYNTGITRLYGAVDGWKAIGLNDLITISLTNNSIKTEYADYDLYITDVVDAYKFEVVIKDKDGNIISDYNFKAGAKYFVTIYFDFKYTRANFFNTEEWIIGYSLDNMKDYNVVLESIDTSLEYYKYDGNMIGAFFYLPKEGSGGAYQTIAEFSFVPVFGGRSVRFHVSGHNAGITWDYTKMFNVN